MAYAVYNATNNAPEWKARAKMAESAATSNIVQTLISGASSIYKEASEAPTREAQANYYKAGARLTSQKADDAEAESAFSGGLLKDLQTADTLRKSDAKAADALMKQIEADPNYKLKMAALQKRLALTDQTMNRLEQDSNATAWAFGNRPGAQGWAPNPLRKRSTMQASLEGWRDSFDTIGSGASDIYGKGN